MHQSRGRRLARIVGPWLFVGLSLSCRGTLELALNDADVVLSRQLLDAPNPAERGPREVRTLFYGSGTDKNTDAGGTVASLPLSRYGVIRRHLEMRVLRRRDLEDDRFASLFELVLQSYSIPLADFVEAAPGLHIESLRSVGLVFDRSSAGEVIVDDVGFTRMDPAYPAVRVPSS